MTTAEHLHTLPIWLLLAFIILSVGVIALIYSRGNWRTAFAATGVTILLTILIAGMTAWRQYLNSHFIGQYDELGIPFQIAAPGWSVLTSTWPLWLIPAFLASLFVSIAAWILYRDRIKQTVTDSSPTATAPIKSASAAITKQLGSETTKQELAGLQEKLTITIAELEQQISKNIELENTIQQMTIQQRNEITELNRKITDLEGTASADLKSHSDQKPS